MRIFISHSSRDKSVIRELTADLPRNLGLWVDEDQLAFDRDVSARLKDVISAESDLVLAFLSKHSLESKWVESELRWAEEEEEKRGVILLLPVLLDGISEHPGLRDLAKRQHLRVTDFSKMGIQAAARKLERMLFHLLLERLPVKTRVSENVNGFLAQPSPRNDTDRVLIVRHGGSPSKRFAVRCCVELGLKPTVIDSAINTDAGFHGIDCDPRDWDQLLPEVEKDLEEKGTFRSAITFEELEVLTTARLARYLGCERVISVAAAKRCRDKFLTRQALNRAGIPQVRYCVAASPGEAQANISASKLRYPLIVKPRNGALSLGVEKVESAKGLVGAFNRVRGDIARVRDEEGGAWKILNGSTLLIEEYIQEDVESFPREMSVEAVVNEGVTYILALHDKLEMRKEPPYFEPIFVSPPPQGRYSKEEIQAIEQVVRDSVRALGVEYGPIHAELRMGAEGPVLLEIGARPGGGIIPDSILKRRGVDIRTLAIKIATGRFNPKVDVPNERDVGTCLGIVYSEKRGELQAIDGVSDEELRNRGDVFINYPLAKPGKMIVQEELVWLLDVGICSDKGVEDAYRRFCDIRNSIKYKVDDQWYRGRDLSTGYPAS